MNKKIAIVGIILLVIVIGGYMIMKKQEPQALQDSPPSMQEEK